MSIRVTTPNGYTIEADDAADAEVVARAALLLAARRERPFDAVRHPRRERVRQRIASVCLATPAEPVLASDLRAFLEDFEEPTATEGAAVLLDMAGVKVGEA